MSDVGGARRSFQSVAECSLTQFNYRQFFTYLNIGQEYPACVAAAVIGVTDLSSPDALQAKADARGVAHYMRASATAVFRELKRPAVQGGLNEAKSNGCTVRRGLSDALLF
jgi:hypothetical protein